MTPQRRALIEAHKLLAQECERNDLRILDVGIAGDNHHISDRYPIWGRRAVRFRTLDIDGSLEPDFVADISRRTEFGEDAWDLVLCGQVLEHVWDFAGAAREIGRIGRSCIVDVPWQYPYHPEPNDFWRFSPEAIERILRSAGFDNVDAWFIADETVTIAHAWKD